MKRNAFTFIELIIGITIFTVVIVTVYSAFNMGIKAWRRGQTEKSLQRIRLAFLKIDKELKDTFFFSEISFKGTPDQMEFPLTISGEDREKLYKITYTVDTSEEPGLKELTRKEIERSKDTEEPAEEKTRKLLTSIKSESVGFEYTGPSQDFEWQKTWDGRAFEELPSAVRVSLQMDDSEEIYSKVIFLQQGELGLK